MNVEGMSPTDFVVELLAIEQAQYVLCLVSI